MKAIATSTAAGKFQISATLLLTLFAVGLPFVIHLIPAWQDESMGAVLLPLYYMPLLGVFFFRLHVPVIVGLVTPFLNYLVTGHPHPEFAGLLSIELAVFALAARSLSSIQYLNNITGPVAFAVSKLAGTLLLLIIPFIHLQFDALPYLMRAFVVGWPGILVLAILSYLFVNFRKN